MAMFTLAALGVAILPIALVAGSSDNCNHINNCQAKEELDLQDGEHPLRGQKLMQTTAKQVTLLTEEDSVAESSKLIRQQLDAGMLAQRARVGFVKNPVPMPGQEMAKVDTTGMVRRTNGELTFFTHPTDQDMFVSASISPTGYWEKDKSDEFCQEYGNIAGKADFLDVGANIGTWSIPMAQCLNRLNRGGSVIAVEALELNAKHMAASVHANSLHNIDLYNYAVGEGGPKDQVAELVNADNKGGSAIVDGSADGTELVSMTTLDAILADRLAFELDSRIFAMKMDIEGYELYALQGAPNLLSADHRPCLIFIKLRIDTHESSAKAMKLLEDSGYQRIEDSSTRIDHLMCHKDCAAHATRFASK
mmetsp:Transcript_65143/g.125789  ORF Transcript_65143/g.125789 Transcript_65143/m.125789 type:complete len:364 (+) Transcript_65143:45-1136(+)